MISGNVTSDERDEILEELDIPEDITVKAPLWNTNSDRCHLIGSDGECIFDHDFGYHEDNYDEMSLKESRRRGWKICLNCLRTYRHSLNNGGELLWD